MRDSALLSSVRGQLIVEGDSTGPPKISVEGDTVIDLPDGSKIEIKAGQAPSQPVFNRYVKKVCENKSRLYSIVVTRPTGEKADINFLNMRIEDIRERPHGITYKKNIYALSSKEKESLKNLFFIVDGDGQVVGLARDYPKE